MPWLLLAMVELALRVGRYGSDYPLFQRAPQDAAHLLINPDVARRYFMGSPFTPTPELEFFRSVRTPRTFRIFFQGESSAQGFPYGHGGMPSRMLELRLQATFPDREIEVVNTALTGVSSYTLLDQAEEIIAQQPDAILIYTGHNEYFGVFGVGSSRGFGQQRALVRAYLSLVRLRTVQLLGNVIAAGTAARAEGGQGARTVMELLAGEQYIPLGSRRFAQGIEQFRANLGELLSRYRERRIPVLIGTVASNERDQPPLAGSGASADSADLYYANGRQLESHGDTLAARAAYRQAKERDPLRFRAPEAINAVIREQAARHGAVVVETQRAVEQASPGGIPDRTLMLEHVHPNLDGYFLLANAFYDAMRAQRMIGPWTAAVPASIARRDVAVTPLDSLVGLLRTDRLLSGWPFQPPGTQRTPIVDTLRPRTETERLAQSVVLGRLPWPEATERLRMHAEQAGDDALAARAASAMAQEYSFSPEPLLDLAELSLRAERSDDALRHARAAIARQSTLRGAQMMGTILLRRGDVSAALPYLQRAAAAAPRDRRVVARFRAAGALRDLEDQRERTPRDTVALYNLAVAYALTDQNARARAMLRELQRIAPRHRGAMELLRRLSP